MKTNLLALDRTALESFCRERGHKPFRAHQLQRWIHQRGVGAFEGMTDLAKDLRQELSQCASIDSLDVVSEVRSDDGTVKWLFDVGGGDVIESVFIPEDDRGTLCISSQAGCAVGCTFCSTGHQGFSRNLDAGQIVAQMWHAQRTLSAQMAGQMSRPRAVTNVVMMGMGEPLQNYGPLVTALNLFLDDLAYGLSRRRVTVSTSGVVPMIDRLALDCPVALAVSLHAPNDALRDHLVPLNRKYPIAQLLAACKRYLEAAPRDFVTFEYCMLDGVNDSTALAHELVALLQDRELGFKWCKLNLIPFNPFPASGLRKSPAAAVEAFAAITSAAGVVTTVRKTRGDDIDAACGQLAGEVRDRTDARPRMVDRRQRMQVYLRPATMERAS